MANIERLAEILKNIETRQFTSVQLSSLKLSLLGVNKEFGLLREYWMTSDPDCPLIQPHKQRRNIFD